MKVDIISSRKGSSMVSSWTEYLCLTGGITKRFKLFTGRYEGLDEAMNYYDEEKDDFVLPAVIAGKRVHGIEDEAVVGGDLGYYGDDDSVEFDGLEDSDLLDWLRRQKWTKQLSIVAAKLQGGR